MKTNQKYIVEQNKRLIGIILFVPILLSVPLIAMQFTQEVNWNLFDFVVAGILLLTVGVIAEMIMRMVKTFQLKTALLVMLFLILCLVWVELAVGVFGTPFAGN